MNIEDIESRLKTKAMAEFNDKHTRLLQNYQSQAQFSINSWIIPSERLKTLINTDASARIPDLLREIVNCYCESQRSMIEQTALAAFLNSFHDFQTTLNQLAANAAAGAEE